MHRRGSAGEARRGSSAGEGGFVRRGSTSRGLFHRHSCDTGPGCRSRIRNDRQGDEDGDPAETAIRPARDENRRKVRRVSTSIDKRSSAEAAAKERALAALAQVADKRGASRQRTRKDRGDDGDESDDDDPWEEETSELDQLRSEVRKAFDLVVLGRSQKQQSTDAPATNFRRRSFYGGEQSRASQARSLAGDASGIDEDTSSIAAAEFCDSLGAMMGFSPRSVHKAQGGTAALVREFASQEFAAAQGGRLDIDEFGAWYAFAAHGLCPQHPERTRRSHCTHSNVSPPMPSSHTGTNDS